MTRDKAAPKRGRQFLEMLDGRVFFSDDNWQTVWEARGHPNGKSHRKLIDKHEADRVRFLVVAQSSAGP